MLCQVFGSAITGTSWLSVAHNLQPLQLCPAAAIIIPMPKKNFFWVIGHIFDPLALLLISPTAAFSLFHLTFQ